MKLHHLRALTAIAEQGSINAAARALCVSQPAITRAMRELESEVGVAILTRNSWGVSITEQGRRLLARARLIVHEFERAEADMAELRGVVGGHLCIGVSPLAGAMVISEAFAQFRLAMPEVSVEFREWNLPKLLDNLRNSRLDFALAAVPGAPVDDAFVACEPLLSLPTAFVTRHGSRYAGATSFAELQDAEWLHADATEQFPGYIKTVFARYNLPLPRRITRCTSNLLTSKLLLNVDTVMALTRHVLIVAPEPKLVQLDLPEDPPALQIALLQREGAIMTSPSDYFIHCIREAAARQRGSSLTS